MKYKVGDRVWCKEVIGESEGYYTIKEIDGVGVTFEEGFSVLFSSISHQAQTMFEKLGYISYNLCHNDELLGYQWQDNETFKDHLIRNIMFYKDKTWNIFQDHICKAIVFDRPTIEEHRAIHQQLIELGWI